MFQSFKGVCAFDCNFLQYSYCSYQFFTTPRCVPDNERAYALGLQWIFLSLLGSLPGPVLFGIFIDKSCDLWEKTCHGTGNCLQYNNVKLSYMLCGATALFQGKSCMTFITCILKDLIEAFPFKAKFQISMTNEIYLLHSKLQLRN